MDLWLLPVPSLPLIGRRIVGKDYIQTYDDEVRCQFWWDAFKVVVPPVFEEKSNV